jgi:hypothetical protein
VYLGDTAGCWDCCKSALDTVQVAQSASGPWINATVTLNQSGTLRVTPVTPAVYTVLRYAAHTWPQCVILSASNFMPAPPALLNVTIPAPQLPERVARAGTARAHLLAQRSALIPVAAFGPKTWRSWRGQAIPRAGSGALLPTPPMGLNTWNAFHTNVDETLLQATADALVSLGLAALGYDYVNIDDVRALQ